jgi:hypothetical protein
VRAKYSQIGNAKQEWITGQTELMATTKCTPHEQFQRTEDLFTNRSLTNCYYKNPFPSKHWHRLLRTLTDKQTGVDTTEKKEIFKMAENCVATRIWFIDSTRETQREGDLLVNYATPWMLTERDCCKNERTSPTRARPRPSHQLNRGKYTEKNEETKANFISFTNSQTEMTTSGMRNKKKKRTEK